MDNEICSICLEEVLKHEHEHKVSKCDNCNKHFHKKCLKEWFKTKEECPLCRHKYNSIELISLLKNLYQRYNIGSTIDIINNFIIHIEDDVQNLNDLSDEINSENNVYNNFNRQLLNVKSIINSIKNVMEN